MVDVQALLALVPERLWFDCPDDEDALRRGIVALGKEIADHERAMTVELEARDRAQDALQEVHSALGGSGEWAYRSGFTEDHETGDLHVDAVTLAEAVTADRDALRAENARLKSQLDDMEGRYETAHANAMHAVNALERTENAIRTRCSHTCAGREQYEGKLRHEPNCLAFEMDLVPAQASAEGER